MSGLINKTLTTGAAEPQHVGTVPDCTYATVNVIISNPSGGLVQNEVAVTLYMSSDPAQADQIDMVDPKAYIPVDGRYVYACAVTSPDEHIFVKTDTAGLVVRVEAILAD